MLELKVWTNFLSFLTFSWEARERSLPHQQVETNRWVLDHNSYPLEYQSLVEHQSTKQEKYVVDYKILNLKKNLKIPKGLIRNHISKKKQHNGKKVQRDKQRSTKHTYKAKDRVTRTPLKTGGELRCSRTVNSSCSNSDTRRVNLVTNAVISHERVKDREVFATNGTYSWLFVTQICHSCQPSHGSDSKTFEVMTST